MFSLHPKETLILTAMSNPTHNPEPITEPITPKPTTQQKRQLESPDQNESNKKPTKNTDPTIYVYTTFQNLTTSPHRDSTELLNEKSKNVLILNAKNLRTGTILKIHKKDLTKSLSKENWKDFIECSLTKTTINHHSYCILNVDKEYDLDQTRVEILFGYVLICIFEILVLKKCVTSQFIYYFTRRFWKIGLVPNDPKNSSESSRYQNGVPKRINRKFYCMLQVMC